MRIFVQKQPFSVWNSHFSVMRISWFRHAAEILNLNLEEDVLPSWYPGKDIINRNAQLKSLNTEDGTSDYLISFPDLVNYANQRFFIIFNFQSIIFFAKNTILPENFLNEIFRNLNFDVHFASQMSQCHPCAINYDYIIKLETIYEDIQARFQQRENFSCWPDKLVTELLLVTILKPYSKMNNGQNHYRLTTVHFCHQHRLCLSTSVTQNPSPTRFFSLW